MNKMIHMADCALLLHGNFLQSDSDRFVEATVSLSVETKSTERYPRPLTYMYIYNVQCRHNS